MAAWIGALSEIKMVATTCLAWKSTLKNGKYPWQVWGRGPANIGSRAPEAAHRWHMLILQLRIQSLESLKHVPQLLVLQSGFFFKNLTEFPLYSVQSLFQYIMEFTKQNSESAAGYSFSQNSVVIPHSTRSLLYSEILKINQRRIWLTNIDFLNDAHSFLKGTNEPK